MDAWRLLKTKYATHAFDGEGARLYGGRWNSSRRPVIYVSSSLALAVLEILVHLDDTGPLPAYSQARVSFDASIVETLSPAELPSDWTQDPAPASTRAIGNAWLEEARTPVLRIPSTVIHSETNFLLNPRHPGFDRIALGSLEAVSFDSRLHPALGVRS